MQNDRSKPQRSGNTILFVAGLIFGLPGVAILIWGLSYWSAYLKMARWQEVDATVLAVSFEIDESRDAETSRRTVTYSVDCRYRYEFNGQAYESDRVDIVGGNSSERKLHRLRYRKLKEARDEKRPVTAWVNPDEPTQAVLFRDADVVMYFLPGFGLLFALAGGGLLFGGIVSTRRRRRRTELAERYADRPWRMRDDWARFGARACSSGLAGLWLNAIFTLLGGVFFTVVLLLIDSVIFIAWVPVAIVYLAALGVMGWAAYRTAQRIKFGRPVLVFSELPISPGRGLHGLLVVSRHLLEAGALKLTLMCKRGNPRIEINGRPRMEPVFQETQTATADMLRPSDQLGTVVPVQFDRLEEPPANGHGEDQPVAWSLRVASDSPGVNFQAEFDLPVFPLDDSSRVEPRPAGIGLP
jgi:hypothetical protein